MYTTAASVAPFAGEHTFPVGSTTLTRDALASLFEALPIAVLVSDSSTREVLAANPASVELYGYLEDELVGATPPFPWHADDGLLRRKDGTLVPVEIRSSPLFDAHGASSLTAEVITDISRQRRLEQQLGHAGKRATIGEPAAGVAHKLNNPLCGILGLVEFLLRDTEPGSRSHERLLLVQQSAREMKQTIEEGI
jgi:signal transduction histidine kinase